MLQSPFSSLSLYLSVEGSKHRQNATYVLYPLSWSSSPLLVFMWSVERNKDMQNITNLSPLLVYLFSLWQVCGMHLAGICWQTKKMSKTTSTWASLKLFILRLAVLQHAGMHEGLLFNMHLVCLILHDRNTLHIQYKFMACNYFRNCDLWIISIKMSENYKLSHGSAYHEVSVRL